MLMDFGTKKRIFNQKGGGHCYIESLFFAQNTALDTHQIIFSHTNCVLHLYISHFVVLLVLVRSKLFINFVGAVAEFLMYLQTQHHAVNFWILSSQKWPQIGRAWESLPAFSGTFTLNVGILTSVVLYPLLIYMLLPPDGWPFCWLCKNVKIELEKGFQLQKIWQFC